MKINLLFFGLLGEGFELAGFQKYLTIFSGVCLIMMAIFSFGSQDFASKIPFINSILLKLKMSLGKLIQKTNYSSRFLTGVLNGFLPCGMVYVALTASLAAGGMWQGALFMVLFGLGTFPFMFAVVLFGNLINTATRTQVLKFVPIMMLVLGGLFIVRALELGIPYLSPKAEVLQLQQKKDMHEKCH